MLYRNSLLLAALSIAVAACSDTTGPRPGPQGPTRGFVTVSPGVRLEVLNFGGSGEPVLFLAGSGNTAHVFEGFAERFTDHYHVYALTRRGFGASSQPASGYDTRTLSEDIRIVLDSLGIATVHLIGHSISGDEITRFAGDHPDRVGRLVYLDAAYDRIALGALIAAHPFPDPPAPTLADIGSFSGFSAYVRRLRGVSIPKAELRATTVFAADGSVADLVTPAGISAALLAGEEAPDYSRVNARALGIYAVPQVASDLVPWLTPASPDWAAAGSLLGSVFGPYYQGQRASFASSLIGSTVLELPGANHYLFISNADAVATAVQSFLAAP